MNTGALEGRASLPVLAGPAPSAPTGLARRWRILFGPDPRLIEQGFIANRVNRKWFTWEYDSPAGMAFRLERYQRQRQLNYLRVGLEQVLGEWPKLHAPLLYDEDNTTLVLTLPLTFLGGDDARMAVSELVRKRLGGKWRTIWAQNKYPPTATFVRLPPPGHPPKFVTWGLSQDPWQIYVGETFTGPKYVNIRTQTPHFGVTATSGGGKTTCLVLPVVHARIMLGALVDIIDLKEDSFDEYFEDTPGIRIHRSAESAVMAIAEFFTSIKGLRTAKLKGYDTSQVPPRFLVIDELGSFILAAETWWKYGIQGKGPPPFLAMFNMILMQGRTKDHRVVVGTHQFSLANFKSTDARDLIGSKIAVGPCSAPKWVTTFGLDTPRIKYDDLIPGRGVIGITGSGGGVEEIQLAYLTPEDARTQLGGLDAPGWFDDGEMAPWIDQDAIELATREGYAGPFLPGGQFITPGLSLVPGRQAMRLLAPVAAVPVPVEVGLVTLREAADRGVIPVSYETARKDRLRNVGDFPGDRGKRGGAFLFDGDDLSVWYERRG